MSGNIIQLNEQFINNELKTIVKNSVEETLNALLDAEADKLVQAERYAREQTRKGYRAGHYERSFSTQAGDVMILSILVYTFFSRMFDLCCLL